jgi:hypothetical protein
MENQKITMNNHSMEEIQGWARRLQNTYGFSVEEALELSAIEAGYESYIEIVNLVQKACEPV